MGTKLSTAMVGIESFTVAGRISRLPADVGRPMEHLATQFDVGQLLAEARAVLDSEGERRG
jgi:hypothetical protein